MFNSVKTNQYTKEPEQLFLLFNFCAYMNSLNNKFSKLKLKEQNLMLDHVIQQLSTIQKKLEFLKEKEQFYKNKLKQLKLEIKCVKLEIIKTKQH